MLPSQVSQPELIGRDAARRGIAELIARAASGQGGAVIVTGPAGIGKSALLRDAARQVGSDPTDRDPQIQVAHVVGAAAEQDWPYAGLHLVLSALSGSLGLADRAVIGPTGDSGADASGTGLAAGVMGQIADADTTYQVARPT